MSNLQVFNHEKFGSIRTIGHNGEPWFIHKDICDALDLGNPSQTASYLDGDEKDIISNDTLGGTQEMIISSEAGLYSLILRSRKLEAKAFKRWVTHDILPSIRKHGAYFTPAKIEELLTDPDTIIKLATDLKAERQQRIALEDQVERDRPKVIFADAVDASQTSILVGVMAKLLRQNNVKIGPNRLFQWLRDNGYLISRQGESRNMPTQWVMERGFFEVKERVVCHPDGSNRTTRTPMITGAGQIHLVDVFMKAMEGAA